MSSRKRLDEFQKRARQALSSGIRSTPIKSSGPLPGFGSSDVTPVPRQPIMWSCLKSFLRVLDKSSRTFGPLKTVMGELIRFIEVHESALVARHGYETLKSDLEALFSDLCTHFSGNGPLTMTESICNLCDAIMKELDQISTTEGTVGRRYLGANQDLNEVMECYHRIHGHLNRLTLNADLSTWKIVDEKATEARLNKLTPSMSACYNSAEAALVRRRECTPNTRERVLSELSDWRHDKNQGNMYWLNGMAGTGKTTIANSLCVMLDRSHELGASFFCTRLLPECRNAKLILPTIAYQLARFSRPFCCALSQRLERDPDVHTRALSNQLRGMIIDPLREVAHTLPTDLVVVIDALEECDDNNGVGQILELFAKHASNLPIKIFVSSRPEPQIRQRIGDTRARLILHELDKSVVRGDIEKYLRTELAPMSLSEAELSSLVEDAGTLFIYAATVVRYIGAGRFCLNPRRRLAVVLGASASPSKNKDIDDLYDTILDSAFNDPELEPSDRDLTKLVLDTVICAQEPLTVDALAGLLQLGGTDAVNAALRSLWSVIHIYSTSSLVTTLHASFLDYMLDSTRSKERNCRAERHHEQLAKLCFERIENNEQQFNICGLKSSHLYDEQVSDLEERINRAIPLELAYACQYWAVHLEQGERTSKHAPLLDGLLSRRLFLWMEVLNLKKRMKFGAASLEKARRWSTTIDSPPALKMLIHDAWRFLTMFATNPVSGSTPHIYVSMLASWPVSRPLTNCYMQRANGLVHFGGMGVERRELALLGLYNVDGSIFSVMFSPDSMCIVSGSNACTICVWNAQSGQMILGPLEGHTNTILSAAFSPNGMHIVSGSIDNTVCVWDTQNGDMVLGPLEGHLHWVLSVTFSPDSRRIASGSRDNTICVWDARSGEMMLGPLGGHTDQVTSVAFSPDGAHIASGSCDTTICVWDAQSGDMILGPLKGHMDQVHSVSFSPDGVYIASGSSDTTVRLWDAQGGETVLKPLEGHSSAVNSVSFSPDSIQIVSGSDDRTICIWDAQSGELVLELVDGHTAPVNSVAFSPDSTRIVSGSSDRKICVWDAQWAKNAFEPPEQGVCPVTLVAFSPDGTCIASCSPDARISACIWDGQSGEMVLGLSGRTGPILSAAFSLDFTRIAYGSYNNLTVWDLQNRELVLGPLEHTDSVDMIAFSPDTKRIAAGSEDQICMWDAQSGEVVLGPLSWSTTSIVFSPDSTYLASGLDRGTVCVWDAHTGQKMLGPLEGHTNFVISIEFSPDNTRIVSGSNDYTIIVWDAQNGDMVLGPLEEHSGWVRSVTFSPNGRYIASGSDDHTINLWDSESGEIVLGPLSGHIGSVNSVAFSPDGMRIVSGSDDGTIRVWEVPIEQPANNTLLPDSGHITPSVQENPSPHKELFIPDPQTHNSFSWSMGDDGWVLDEHGRLLLWVPPDLRGRLLIPQNTLLISPQGPIQLDFEDAKIGECWIECYAPV